MPGDPVIPVSPFAEMKDPKYLLGKAWDDRIGCAVFMEVIRNLQGVVTEVVKRLDRAAAQAIKGQ